MAYRDVILADNPLAFYEFTDGTAVQATDSVGSNHLTARYAGVADFSSIIASEPDGVSAGQGAAAGGFASAATAVRLSRLAASSIEAWIRLGANPPSTQGIVVESVAGAGNGALFGFIAQTGGVVNFFRRNLDSGGNLGTLGGLADRLDHHIVATLGAGTLRLYLDGQQVATASYSGSITNTNRFAVGRIERSTPSPMLGRYDGVALYNYALSGAQILAHYQAGLQAVETKQGAATVSGGGVVSGQGRRSSKGGSRVGADGSVSAAGRRGARGAGSVSGNGSIVAAVGPVRRSGGAYLLGGGDARGFGRRRARATISVVGGGQQLARGRAGRAGAAFCAGGGGGVAFGVGLVVRREAMTAALVAGPLVSPTITATAPRARLSGVPVGTARLTATPRADADLSA